MAKRVKKDVRMEYARGLGQDERRMTLTTHAGDLRVTVSRHGATVCFDLPACDVETLWATAVLEDVPEPWERVRDALTQAWREMRGCEVGPFPDFRLPTDRTGVVLERVAELLSIKPEGE